MSSVMWGILQHSGGNPCEPSENMQPPHRNTGTAIFSILVFRNCNQSLDYVQLVHVHLDAERLMS